MPGNKRVGRYPVTIDREDLKFRLLTAVHVAGLTMVDVADYLGISVSIAIHIVDGSRAMSVDFLVNFCAVCRCSISDIIPFSDDLLPFPYSIAVRGGGAVTEIAPDPYKISYADPEFLSSRKWSKLPESE